MKSVDGVTEARVNLATERATVEFMPGVVTVTDLKQAVSAAGYEAFETNPRPKASRIENGPPGDCGCVIHLYEFLERG